MVKSIIVFTLLASLSAVAQSAPQKQLKFESQIIAVEDFEVDQSTELSRPMGTVVGDIADIMNPLNEAELIIDKIINMGQKVWNIIAKGKPVVNYTQNSAAALPQGVRDWTQIQGWSGKSLTAQLDVTNGFGTKKVKFIYKVIFLYNGNIKGVGKYIGHATIVPAEIMVGWGGYSFNAEVSVPQVFNMGTTEDPVAGMKIQVKYSTDTIVQHQEFTDSYIISGTGLIKAM